MQASCEMAKFASVLIDNCFVHVLNYLYGKSANRTERKRKI